MIIETSKTFDKKFKKLPQKVKLQAKRRITLFMEDRFNPILKDHMLHGDKREYRSINISGDLRVIYEKVSNGTARFIDIGTHSELY